MKIIRDDNFGGVMMIPLFCDWNVRRCNVKDCTNVPSTIIAELSPDAPVTGWCEDHYQDFKNSGTFDGTLIFDDYDAFVEERRKNGTAKEFRSE